MFETDEIAYVFNGQEGKLENESVKNGSRKIRWNQSSKQKSLK